MTPYLVSAATLIAMLVIYLRFTTFKELLGTKDVRLELMNQLVQQATGSFSVWEVNDSGLVKLPGLQVEILTTEPPPDSTGIRQKALKYRISNAMAGEFAWQQGYLLLAPWDPGEVLMQTFFYKGAFSGGAPPLEALTRLNGCEFIFKKSATGLVGSTMEDFCCLPFESGGYQRLRIQVGPEEIRFDYDRFVAGEAEPVAQREWLLRKTHGK